MIPRMGHTLRTFVAVRCSEHVCARIRETAERLRRLDGALRPPRTDDFHVTLQFLGDTNEADVVPIGKALQDALTAVSPFAVAYGGLGAFPTPARARVVWAAARELESPSGAFAALAGAVGAGLDALGFPPERRAFHPHVTLGRVRRRPSAELVAAVEAAQDLDLGRDEVSEVKLILSDPGSRGYSYVDLTTVALGEG